MGAVVKIVDRSDEHAVVGAGFVGLGMMAGLQRHGIRFTAYEGDDDLGGNWYHGVYETVHIISSRKTTEYGDWPMPADWPDFPSKDQMLQYLRAFADAHGLRERIRFGTQVLAVRPRDDGSWELDLSSGETVLHGGVVVAIGHHWDRRWPQVPGNLTIEKIHSKDYKRPAQLAGKRVLVIGGGNSACDIAVEAARFAACSHISLRRGYWFLPKTFLGIPLTEWLQPWMPEAVQKQLARFIARSSFGSYARYGLPEPDHAPFEKHPTINSELLYHIRHGRIEPRADVRRWDGARVEFVDGRRDEYDLVVCATGYHMTVPFVGDDVVRVVGEMPQLVNGVLPVHHRNFYMTSFGQPRYGAGPIITLGAEAIACMIEHQRTMAHPIGAVLQRLGEGVPKSELMDPFLAMRNCRRAIKMLPRIAARERRIMAARSRLGATAALFSPV
jgi:cation diffusion facilitator CzcD-associated flavoprotein CzcO